MPNLDLPNLEDTVRAKLEAAFQPTHLEVVNQSAQHAGHAGSPDTGNSHFAIDIRAPIFAGKNRVEAQRMVYSVLADELRHGIHALALKVST